MNRKIKDFIAVAVIAVLAIAIACFAVESSYHSDYGGDPDVVRLAAKYASTSKDYHDLVYMDSVSSALVGIDIGEHMVNQSDSYVADYNNLTTNTGEMTVIAFATPNTTKYLHMVATGTTTGAAAFSICETTSIDPNEGTAKAVYNQDRNSDNTSGILTLEDPPDANDIDTYDETAAASANITETTKIWDTVLDANSTQSSPVFILQKNTEYAVIIEADTDDDSLHSIVLNWYELTNKH